MKKSVEDVYDAAMEAMEDSFIDGLSQEAALVVLDGIHAEAVALPGYDGSADFGDLDYPTEKLGRLLMKAFHPKRFRRWGEDFSGHNDWEMEEMWEEWHKCVTVPFRGRYGYNQNMGATG